MCTWQAHKERKRFEVPTISPTGLISPFSKAEKESTKLFAFKDFDGAPGGTRTPGLLIRSQALYPAELRAHYSFIITAVQDEIEIKLKIGDLADARRLIEAQGFHIAVPEVFERNIVLDNSAGQLRESCTLLRLRSAGHIATLTFKGVTSAGKYKAREERETIVSNFGEMLIILNRLGYRETFVYEKYRTEFRGDTGGVITLDETPVGNYMEIEGPAEWIDATAHRFGFAEADYITSSYGTIYLERCHQRGAAPANMIFTAPRSVPAPILSPP